MGLLLRPVLWVQILLHLTRPALPAASGGRIQDITNPTFIDECVQAHNRHRSSVNPPAANMYYMTWDEALAKSARAWARTCRFSHNRLLQSPGRVHPDFSLVGENIWVGNSATFSPTEAIQHWYSEVVNYTYVTGSCRKMCGHYTQVVWAESHKVGCAAQVCSGMKDFPTTGNIIIFVCNYGIAGNRKGVHPYKEGPACSACQGDICQNKLCRNSQREQLKSYSWTPDWETDVLNSSSTISNWMTAPWPGPLSVLLLLCLLVLQVPV